MPMVCGKCRSDRFLGKCRSLCHKDLMRYRRGIQGSPCGCGPFGSGCDHRDNCYDLPARQQITPGRRTSLRAWTGGVYRISFHRRVIDNGSSLYPSQRHHRYPARRHHPAEYDRASGPDCLHRGKRVDVSTILVLRRKISLSGHDCQRMGESGRCLLFPCGAGGRGGGPVGISVHGSGGRHPRGHTDYQKRHQNVEGRMARHSRQIPGGCRRETNSP